MDYVIAQVNIGRLAAPLDSPRLAGFVANLGLPGLAASPGSSRPVLRRREKSTP